MVLEDGRWLLRGPGYTSACKMTPNIHLGNDQTTDKKNIHIHYLDPGGKMGKQW